jgi:NAD(P)-dependent dehydrogenase (short-subunit alcohol dehydrogenase family)/acyl carrier protein
VDIVLNSLAGEAIPRSLACLAPRGRFLEIGKRDIYENSAIGLEPFKRNLSFFAIDLAGMVEQNPEDVARMFHEVMALFAAGELKPIPTTAYPVDAVADAFRTMAQARHTGKIVVSLRGRPASVQAAAGIVRPDASYLITGGLGALGLVVAERLAQRGARHLALMGRGAPSQTAQAAIMRIERAGARVAVLRGDVAVEADVASALAEVEATMPPLRGVIHAAGVLADATVAQLDAGRLDAALAPKVAGAWHLHRLTLGRQLDHFVLFSSVAALLGSPGQGNYAAGNAFLDALAQLRRTNGLPASSIAWGPWSEIGLAAARTDRGERLAQRGVGSIAPHAGLAALERLMEQHTAYVAVMPFDAGQWCESYPAAAASFLAGLRATEEAPRREQHLRAMLLASEPGKRRRALLEDHLREQLAQVLRLPLARIDAAKPLKSMGLDSLMAIEFKNRLEGSLGLALSATLAWNYPTIAVLADYLAGRMEITLDAPAPQVEAAPQPAPADELVDLTQDEVEALLSDELAAVEALLKDG